MDGSARPGHRATPGGDHRADDRGAGPRARRLRPGLLARLSPLQNDHIILGRYAFTQPPAPGRRPLRDPHSDDETDDGEDG
ncbi:hypothetical protein ACFVT2_13220 [Streptomyces sp. NPDC058000]|uniref:hypothetical protein n=1 Tax=Streptomyces sp. NPDC058000 TaxID=3346299 RepID=UPI0036E32D43